MKKRTILAVICLGAGVYVYQTCALEDSSSAESTFAVPQMPIAPTPNGTEHPMMAEEVQQELTTQTEPKQPTVEQPEVMHQAPAVEPVSESTQQLIDQGNAEMVPVPQAPSETEFEVDEDEGDEENDEDENDDSLLDYSDFI